MEQKDIPASGVEGSIQVRQGTTAISLLSDIESRTYISQVPLRKLPRQILRNMHWRLIGTMRRIHVNSSDVCAQDEMGGGRLETKLQIPGEMLQGHKVSHVEADRSKSLAQSHFG
jgi:hypothetical protein